MRPDDFPPSAMGEVRRVRDGDYWAFFPAEVPREIEYTSEIVQPFEQATGALHRLSGVGRLLPNPHLLIAPYVRLEAVLSSRIEGTQSDVADLLRFEAGDEGDLCAEPVTQHRRTHGVSSNTPDSEIPSGDSTIGIRIAALAPNRTIFWVPDGDSDLILWRAAEESEMTETTPTIVRSGRPRDDFRAWSQDGDRSELRCRIDRRVLRADQRRPGVGARVLVPNGRHE